MAEEMSERYNLMTHCAHSLLQQIERGLSHNENSTIETFREDNKAVCKRVFDCILETFGYELSSGQMSNAIEMLLIARRITKQEALDIMAKGKSAIDTPISDANNLSYESRKEVEPRWNNWAYQLGLLLDGVITLQHKTNAQRIEMAVRTLKGKT